MPGTKSVRFSTQSAWLIGAAGFALFWIIARAVLQSITIDEADAYDVFVWRTNPAHWEASSVNHLVNSLLMRLFVSLFGLSAFTVRLPSLIGAAIYILASYRLVRLLIQEWMLQWPLFVCLAYNPFIMDHLVAGRGYSLGVGCLLGAIALAASASSSGDASKSPSDIYRTCCWCSLLLAVSFCSTFSFAVVDAVAAIFIFAWFARRPGVRTARLLLACCGPGLALTGFLAGSILADWRHISLAWGARTLGETARSVIESSYYEPSPYLLNPFLYGVVTRWSYLILPLLGVSCMAYWVWIWREREHWRSKPAARWTAAWGLSAAGILAFALGIHRLMYRFGHILMPLGRRAIFIVPLCMLAIGALLALRTASRTSAYLRRGALVMLWVTAAYFLCCLRLTYFMEWKYNADARELYQVVAWYNHAYGVRDVGSNWRYIAVLNFYRILSGRESLPEITGEPVPRLAEYPLKKQLYVVHYESDAPFIDRERLKVVYHNPETGAAVAIRPAVESAGCSTP